MTTTSSTSSTTSAASIVSTLGSGSGIDTAALINNLLEAQYAAKTKQLTDQSDKLTAQISGVAKLKSGITGFDSALKALVKGGSLTTQPTSSLASVASVSAASGGKLAGLNASLRVETLASAQAFTAAAIDKTIKFTGGTLAITKGSTTPADPPTDTIAVPQDATLDDVAKLINAKTSLGLTATVIADGSGKARLSIKGASGAANAFAIEAPGSSGDPADTTSLAQLTVGGSSPNTAGTTAADAVMYLDGARFTRASNSVTDLIAGVQITLQSAGTTQLGTSAPTASLSQAVSDVVDTYNALHATIAEALDPVNGTLRGDTAATALSRSLQQLTTTPLAAPLAGGVAGAPRTLGDLGVKTNRDGTLSVDSARLASVLQQYPAAVEAMFADGSGASNGGLSAALSSIAARATSVSYGLDASSSRYTKAQAGIATAAAKLSTDSAATKTRMTQQFAAMDSRIAAYKAQQTFLDNQIKAWNRSDD